MALKIIFMGTPEFSVPTLRSINLKYEILSVYTQPPKKRFRGQKIIKSPIHIEAEKLKLSVRTPENFNNESDYKFIKESNANFVIVAAYGQIISKKFLNIENLIFLNIHASLLPKWRGAAPIQRSIMEMDQETGISVMKIVPKLDAGPYMLQKSTNINTNDNFVSLSKKLSEIGSKLIIEALSLFEKGEPKFIDQNEKFATYARKIKKIESLIEWNVLSKKLIAKINGLNPYPGVWFKHKGNRIKIIEADLSEAKGKAGEVLTEDLIIGCQDKAIKIKFLQKEGKKVVDTKSFLAGYKIFKGELLL
jgi:methionyl-tRNA formyltransferase